MKLILEVKFDRARSPDNELFQKTIEFELGKCRLTFFGAGLQWSHDIGWSGSPKIQSVYRNSTTDGKERMYM